MPIIGDLERFPFPLAPRGRLAEQHHDRLLRAEPPSDGALIRVATEDVDLPSGTIRKGPPNLLR